MLNLKIERIKKGWTQSTLAEKVNVNTFTISRYETGESNPPIETLKKLSEVLGVSIDYLLKEGD